MSEDTEVLTAPGIGSAGAETPSTTTESSTQEDIQQPSIQTGKVEPVSQTSSNRGHSKPSFFSSTREKLSQFEYKLKEANDRAARLEDLLAKQQSSNAPAAPEQFVFNSDEDVYRKGIVPSLQEFEKYLLEKADKYAVSNHAHTGGIGSLFSKYLLYGGVKIISS